MRKLTHALLMLTMAIATPAFATVAVSSPSNGATVGSSVQFAATGNTTTCSRGVSSMGVYVDSSLDYVVDAVSLNKTLSLSAGKHDVVVEEWDACGGATTASLEITVNAGTGISVTSPANGATVASPALYAATATTSCASGVAAMGVYVNNNLAYKANGSTLSAQVPLSSGTNNTVVQEWDNCGGSSTKAVSVNVATSDTSAGSKISNFQAQTGWRVWGELPPTDSVCNPCKGVSWTMTQHQSAISLSGNATKFTLSGTKAYADVLFYNPVLGQNNTQGLTDADHKLLPTLHNFTLDQYVYVTDLSVSQSLELDINWYGNGIGMEWGTQCNHLGDGDWDIWNNVDAHWVATGVPCSLNNAAWNHVTIQVQREDNNDLLYKSITVNGVTHTINQTVAPFAIPSSWWGMTINFQMDGNYKISPNTMYLDNATFTYN